MPDATIPQPNTAGDMQQWITLLGSMFGMTGNTTSSETSPEGLSAAMGVFPLILQMVMGQDFSSSAAEKDSQPAVMLLLRQAMEQGMPAIAGAENSAGGYNSTTSALLRNDLEARAAGEGAALIAKNKATYGALRTGQANSLISLINSIINSSRVRNSSTTTPNLASNPAARNAALGAAAAGALGAMKKPGGLFGTRKPAKQKQPELPAASDMDTTPIVGIPDPNPGDIGIDDMLPTPDLSGGPTTEVTTTNTGNFDLGGGSDNFSDLSGFDQSGDGIDLGAFGEPPVPEGEPDLGTDEDWSWLTEGPDNGDDGLGGTEDGEEGL